MSKNDFTSAKKDKIDEFYTRWEDIEKEVNSYIEFNPDVFKNKTILLPADDPFESNFFKFFASHFNDYGLKKIIATSYDPSPIVNTQISLLDDDESTNSISKAYKLEITNVADFDENGVVNINDVESMLKVEKLKIAMGNKSSVLSYLHGDKNPDDKERFSAGDFRSKEVTKLRNESDMIITNPPFSLFRDFIKWINPKEKKFLILGNVNAITYKEFFPFILNNEAWLGSTNFNVGTYFYVPDDFEYKSTYKSKRKIGDRKVSRVSSICWFTNLPNGKRYQKLQLMNMKDNIKFSKHKQIKELGYIKYDNYDAIEVPFTDSIPSDYDGIMGVPITFINKYNPDQFEILGLTSGREEFSKEAWPSKRYVNAIQHNKNGSTTSGSKANTRATILLDKVPEETYYTANNAEGPLKIVYARVLIRKK